MIINFTTHHKLTLIFSFIYFFLLSNCFSLDFLKTCYTYKYIKILHRIINSKKNSYNLWTHKKLVKLLLEPNQGKTKLVATPLSNYFSNIYVYWKFCNKNFDSVSVSPLLNSHLDKLLQKREKSNNRLIQFFFYSIKNTQVHHQPAGDRYHLVLSSSTCGYC